MSYTRKVRRNMFKRDVYSRGGDNETFHLAWQYYQEKLVGPYQRLRNELRGTHKKRTWRVRQGIVPITRHGRI